MAVQAKMSLHPPEDGAQREELAVKGVVEGLQRLGVFAVADEPVDRGEVLALSQLFVKTPEHLQTLRHRKEGRKE